MPGYRVCRLNGDGTVAVTTTIPDDLAAASAYALANGGEVVSAALLDALARPAPAGSVVSVAELDRRLLPLHVRLADGVDGVGADAMAALRAKWDRILAVTARWSTVDLADPAFGLLLAKARADDLLTDAEAAAVTTTG